MWTRNQAEEVLKLRFGMMDGFRKGQWEILSSALEGRDVMAVLPTGGGKSICFQLYAVLAKKLVVVVSPLISLMNDQVRGLGAKGVESGCMHSGQTWEETRIVYMRMKEHRETGFLLYVSPERAVSDSFMESMGDVDIGLFAIDESHCVSQWGHHFRPEYGRLSHLRTWRKNVPMMALTASATPIVLTDIARQLGLNRPDMHVHGFYRKNLYYQVETCKDDKMKHVWLRKAIEQTPTGRIIVYTGTRKDCSEISGVISVYESSVGIYHAGMSTEERKQAQEDYSEGRIRVLVATNAFGMGIDHPDVRLVVHFRIPSNIDSLYQEMGRSGRDGLDSTCLMLYAARDKGLHAHFIQSSDESQDRKRTHWYRLNTLVEYAGIVSREECRHRSILLYYRQKDGGDLTCGHCDLCDPESSRRIHCSITTMMMKTKSSSSKTRTIKKTSSSSSSTINTKLLTDLRLWRQRQATSLQKPAYCIMTNKTLEEIAQRSPSSLEDLASIHGIGPVKLASIGHDVLSLVRSC